MGMADQDLAREEAMAMTAAMTMASRMVRDRRHRWPRLGDVVVSGFSCSFDGVICVVPRLR